MKSKINPTGDEYVGQYMHWYNMMQRCYNKNYSSYKGYGSRGISVHGEWHYFPKFVDDLHKEIGKWLGEGYSLDRINNNGNYESGNIRWATREVQIENQRDKAGFVRPTSKTLSHNDPQYQKPEPRTIFCSIKLDTDSPSVCRYGHIVFHVPDRTVEALS